MPPLGRGGRATLALGRKERPARNPRPKAESTAAAKVARKAFMVRGPHHDPEPAEGSRRRPSKEGRPPAPPSNGAGGGGGGKGGAGWAGRGGWAGHGGVRMNIYLSEIVIVPGCAPMARFSVKDGENSIDVQFDLPGGADHVPTLIWSACERLERFGSELAAKARTLKEQPGGG